VPAAGDDGNRSGKTGAWNRPSQSVSAWRGKAPILADKISADTC
jgi:hypothetical protein